MEATSRLLADHEAAKLLRMLPARLKRLAKANKVPHIALPDGELRFDESDLRVWVAGIVATAERCTPTCLKLFVKAKNSSWPTRLPRFVAVAKSHCTVKDMGLDLNIAGATPIAVKQST